MALLGRSLLAPSLLAPFAAAGPPLAADQVDTALDELAPQKLRAALSTGVARVASHVGVKLDAVFRLLPMAEVDGAIAKLEVSQPRALAAWRRYAGGLGGLMGRSSQVPGEGAAPTLSERLRALAGTMQRDKVVAEPLAAFAEDLAVWEALAARLVEIVSASPELARAVQVRRAKRIALIAAIAAVLAAMAIVARIAWVARSNVRAALAKPDVCAAFEVTPVDLGRVGAELAAEVQAKRKACEDRRAEEARLAEEERQRIAREEAARRARQRFEGDCEALATHVEAGKLLPEDETFAAVQEGKPPSVRRARPDVSPQMEAALMRAMARRPDQRFSDATTFRKAFLDGPIASAPDLAEHLKLVVAPFRAELAKEDSSDGPGTKSQVLLVTHSVSADVTPLTARRKWPLALGLALGLIALAGVVAGLQRDGGLGEETVTTEIKPTPLPPSPRPVPITDLVVEPPAPVVEPRRPVGAPSKTKTTRPPPAPVALRIGYLAADAVPWADVLVDGARVDRTPFSKYPLPVGRHQVTFRAPDGRTELKSIAITEGATTSLRVEFAASR